MNTEAIDEAPLGALAALFTSLGQEINAQADLDAALRLVTHRGLQAVPGAEHAAVTLVRPGRRFETVAATDDLPERVDRIQYDLGHGPCVDAALEDAVFLADDLGTESRWPDFGRLAAEKEGIHSMLSTRMFLEDDDTLAGLNFYASSPNAFDEHARTVGVLLATHGALALTAARRKEKAAHLERALRNSRVIGMAMGILMADYKVTEQQAFDLLRIASQQSNRKLAEVAEEVTVTGRLELPSLRARR